jgi:hypothetical protein
MLMKKGRHRQTDGLVDLRGFLATSTPLHLSRRFVSLSTPASKHLICCMPTLDLPRSAE